METPYRACDEAGIEPKFWEWNGEGSLVAFVISMNEKRRHMTHNERSISAAKAMPLFEKEAAERQREGTLAAVAVKGKSSDKAGELFHVSGDSVERARKVLIRRKTQKAKVRHSWKPRPCAATKSAKHGHK